ncbi:MAG TPA: DUF2171 domain-containing protein [Ktedonobacteraceae bacterium]|jgi:hypothetical protein|nr:DUF2171 domain-containing protein [Ktedonobacteraceae bacterium]
MSDITQQDLHKHMQVFTKDTYNLGHISELYEDSFQVHRGLVGKHIYMPYSVVASVTNEQVHLTLSSTEAEEPRWHKRPDYEDHPGDPTQLMYDREHGVHDPFNPGSPNKG